MEKQYFTNAWVCFDPHFYSEEESIKIYNFLLENIKWNQGEIKLFGKKYKVPRLEAFYAYDNKNYAYSGQNLEVKEFPDFLLKIKHKVEKATNTNFNSVLINYYRDGNDSNGWHSDNEKELGKDPLIASLSFGTSRRFDLKHSTKIEKHSFELNSGSLLLMGGEIQHYWKHQIAKSKKIQTGRINLTFRTIL